MTPQQTPANNTGTASSATQDLLSSFYNIDNLVTVNITLPDATWQTIKNARPRGEFGYIGPPGRYDWYQATSVTISGTKVATQGTTFSNVGIIKKSFAGSFSTTKPSLRLDFTKYDDNETAIEALIGTKSLILNNSIQDPAYIRQPLGYELFRQAGVPNFRCNFAKVIVNGTNMGVYVNLEPLKKRFMEKQFAGNDKGNAYEIELDQDLNAATLDSGHMSFEGFSKYDDKKDVRLVSGQIVSGGLAAAQQVVDLDAFIRFFAMESLLKHWDGYTQQTNNTYVYNDKKAVANPTVADVKLKFIPSGIDQIMQEDRPFRLGNKAVLAQLVNSDATAKAKLFTQIRAYANTIFSTTNQDTVLKPLVDRIVAVLMSAGANSTDVAGPIDVVRKQLKLVRGGAFQLIGEKET
ncbi:cellulosomal protein [Mytilinidion resinicola]|uniref:Cellulosomal protein n=1 Tax=Mytilinidion resinicola TaxID=574789 RepID=A0A6A6YVM3_9PEZI|nr:cellulosomal protein [Mytilinidion resinicola]KAF2811967.1 cellulosomal protein [Mytilinidion resinicola]